MARITGLEHIRRPLLGGDLELRWSLDPKLPTVNWLSHQARARLRFAGCARSTEQSASVGCVSHFQAHAEFDPHHPSALALWCSDGRFTGAVEELLAKLGQPRLDTMTLPGGPALLDATSSSLAGVEIAREAASFLIKAHVIKDVVLVAHEGCGYYRARYRYESPDAMRRRQLADLRSAARWIAGTHSGVVARCYFASVVHTTQGPRVSFEPVA